MNTEKNGLSAQGQFIGQTLQEQNSQYTGIWQSAQILQMPGLCLASKFILSTVYNLHKAGKDCFLSNESFSERLGGSVKKRAISDKISNLHKLGLIVRYIVKDPKTHQVVTRFLFASQKLINIVDKPLETNNMKSIQYYIDNGFIVEDNEGIQMSDNHPEANSAIPPSKLCNTLASKSAIPPSRKQRSKSKYESKSKSTVEKDHSLSENSEDFTNENIVESDEIKKEQLRAELKDEWKNLNPDITAWGDLPNYGTINDIKEKFIDGKEFDNVKNSKSFCIREICRRYIKLERFDINKLSQNEYKQRTKKRTLQEIEKDIKHAEYYQHHDRLKQLRKEYETTKYK